ncbi:MAG: energy-coupling factor ABC transporter ATP-binding protein [Candidatus Delongbacteria bacterium]|jgi:energy-coupling factor transporter ATP-binding protein EcfA2|nr:energy-coupling factor ABC transporter ATP-binding protein [Candidatus Delongbacteria bacterium]
MIKINNLSLSLSGRDILKNINFNLDENKSLVISGTSGSGKTKLLETIAGFEKSYNGEIVINGKPIIEFGNELYNTLGYIGNFRVENNFSENIIYDLVFGLELQNVSNSEIKKKLDNLIKDFRLDKLLKTESKNLSGGEKQLVNICSTIIKEPKILLMDDSMTMIDGDKKKILLDKLIRSKKHTVVMITQEVDVFSDFDKILFLDKGEIYYFGDTSSFMNNHQMKLIENGIIAK